MARLDSYVALTLYGTKPGVASAPLKSLQLPDPDNGIRMTLYYYNQTYFPYNYTEAAQCGVVGGLNFNWCMDERQANATYRGFNYPHQIMSYYALYRAARNHPAADDAAELAVVSGASGEHDDSPRLRADRVHGRHRLPRGAALCPRGGGRGEGRAMGGSRRKDRGHRKATVRLFETAPNPYGSEFSYDTTGQEEVVVWLLYFGKDDAAARTIEHILQYMRSLPNWAYNGGAEAGDVANGGKWLVSAGTGRGDSGKMHYRSGLNAIPLIEW